MFDFFLYFYFYTLVSKILKSQLTPKILANINFCLIWKQLLRISQYLIYLKQSFFEKNGGVGGREGIGEGEGTVSFVSKEFRYFICFDYPRLLSHASIISTAEIENSRYFFHVLVVKGEVFSWKFCIFIVINQLNFDCVSNFLYEYWVITLTFLNSNILLITK